MYSLWGLLVNIIVASIQAPTIDSLSDAALRDLSRPSKHILCPLLKLLKLLIAVLSVLLNVHISNFLDVSDI